MTSLVDYSDYHHQDILLTPHTVLSTAFTAAHAPYPYYASQEEIPIEIHSTNANRSGEHRIIHTTRESFRSAHGWTMNSSEKIKQIDLETLKKADPTLIFDNQIQVSFYKVAITAFDHLKMVFGRVMHPRTLLALSIQDTEHAITSHSSMSDSQTQELCLPSSIRQVSLFLCKKESTPIPVGSRTAKTEVRTVIKSIYTYIFMPEKQTK